ncbi:bacterioferritin [Alteromonas sp. KS69]|jgi:bacterioferritin-associated ferredoxin|uniref:Bacterioferritin-associated ferredoxin n=3 Tax=Alteromonas TaxID=226 RepID=A0AAW7Z3I0_9ALTE|nr:MULTISPECIES: bacterioferritin-associated ferredoxin [Alteromonas]AMJ90619.1 bacterioferritin [Alteromonas sp. Mac2]MBB67397.1 bacterioferritin [Rickettsiales bacterium]PHS48422.1 MAG: bacterioferritin [Alteromonas sp.]AEF04041.1 bacterioferritin-associated ferredoxin [Alteromonas naphthalenivorans]ALM91338.1 Bacterioferritin-associated ferredoxin [Alteromonas stellipolaris LMG 21856]
MFVCMCYGVTDKSIRAAVQGNGVGNMRELREHMELGSQCGKCIQMAQQIIDQTIIDDSMFKNVG